MSTDEVGWVGEAYRKLLQTQSYSTPPRVEGVHSVDLRTFSDESGDFCEVTRIGDDGGLTHFPGFHPAQVNFSVLEPGTIKAWHLHRHQDDLWFIPAADRVLVGLLDVREDSTTYGNAMRFVQGAGQARLLYIPRGIAHGVANVSSRAASVIYFVNRPFDPADPDEHRLPYDLLGAEFWTIQPG